MDGSASSSCHCYRNSCSFPLQDSQYILESSNSTLPRIGIRKHKRHSLSPFPSGCQNSGGTPRPNHCGQAQPVQQMAIMDDPLGTGHLGSDTIIFPTSGSQTRVNKRSLSACFLHLQYHRHPRRADLLQTNRSSIRIACMSHCTWYRHPSLRSAGTLLAIIRRTNTTYSSTERFGSRIGTGGGYRHRRILRLILQWR